jgi:hypothetical protein
MPQSRACQCISLGLQKGRNDHTSMVHDNDPTRLDDGLHHRDGPDGVRDTTTSIADHGRIYGTTLERSQSRDGMDFDTDNLIKAQNLIARYSRIRARDHNPTFTRCSCLRGHVQNTRRRLMVPSELSADSELFSGMGLAEDTDLLRASISSTGLESILPSSWF